MKPGTAHSASFFLFALLAASLAGRTSPAQAGWFQRGDGNNDGLFDISDGVYVLRNVFLGDPPAGCDDAADANDDGVLSITDPIYAMRYLFLDGPPPPPPFGACGPDPTEDALGCESSESCKDFSGLCITQDMLDGLVPEIPAFSFCLPADLISLPLDQLEVAICPADKAGPCGIAQTAGCPVEMTGVAPSADVAGRRLVVVFEGRIANLPVRIKENLFGTTADCTVNLGGAAAGSPFRFEATIPLEGREIAPGVFEISGPGDVTVQAVDAKLAVEGGLLCRLLQLGEQLFVALLASQIESAIQSLADSVGPQLAGLYLCSQ